MRTRQGWAAALLLSAGLLSGCGGGSEEDFCSAFEDLENTEGLTTSESFDLVDDLAGNAPSEIEDDVEVVDDAFGEVRSVVEDTDVDLDLTESELTEEDQAKLDGAFAEADIDEDRVQESFTNMQSWVDENCEAAQ